MKIYGWVRHLYRDEPVSHEERMRLKRRERFRAANDIASQDAVYRLDDFDLEIPCCDEDRAACYGIDAIDALDAFPLPPLTAPLVALALEAA